MPLLKYFAAVGSVLLAALFIANAFMSEPTRPVFASKFDQKTPAWLVSTNTITTDGLARPAPPPPHIATVPVETVGAAPSEAPVKAAKAEDSKSQVADTGTVKIEKTGVAKKKVRVARRQPKTDSDNEDSWNGNSWDNNTWASNSSAGNSSRKASRNSRNSDSWGNNSWDNQKSRDAYAYAPRYRSHKSSDNDWFR